MEELKRLDVCQAEVFLIRDGATVTRLSGSLRYAQGRAILRLSDPAR